MSRPKVHGDRITTAVRLPADLHERLKVTAAERDTSVNHLLVRAAMYYLDNRLGPLGGGCDCEPPLLASGSDFDEEAR